MHDPAYIDLAILGARPKAMAALLRYFRDLDTAEEAFQEACLKALKSWPLKGPPRDPTAWLVLVGRNAGVDGRREASPVVTLNRAVAVWKLRGAGAALEMVDPLKSELDAYFYFHGLRGTLLRELGRRDEARLALTRAIALANSVAEARLIRRELDRLTAS